MFRSDVLVTFLFLSGWGFSAVESYDDLFQYDELFLYDDSTSSIETNRTNIRIDPTLFKSNKLCRFRDYPSLYPPELWHHIAAGFCYFYTIPSRRQENFTNVTLTKWENVYFIPVLDFGDRIIMFDHENETFVNEVIAPTFKIPLYVEQWLECVENAMECCERFDEEEYNVYPTEEFPCPSLWDGWACWPSGQSNTTLSQECPIYSLTSGERICGLYSERHCLADGNWLQMTDTTGCAVAPLYRRRHNFHVIALSISIALTFPAIVIYFSFSKLRHAKDWETFNLPLYRNLLICIIIKNVLSIVSKMVVILPSLDIKSTAFTIMEENGVPCRILAFAENASKNAIFTCMLLVGYFLHRSIARIFAGGKFYKMYLLYLGVFVVSLIPSLAWAIVVAIHNDEHCWVVDENGFQWITDGYKFLILAINLVLLLDIVRVLAIGRVKTDSKTLKSAAKATLFLIPLFGVPLLFTSQRSLFDSNSCSEIYSYVTYVIEACQGVVVALLFCYLNKKVHNEFRRTYRNFAINMEQRYNVKLWRPTGDAPKTASSNVRFSSSVEQRPKNKWEIFT